MNRFPITLLLSLSLVAGCGPKSSSGNSGNSSSQASFNVGFDWTFSGQVAEFMGDRRRDCGFLASSNRFFVASGHMDSPFQSDVLLFRSNNVDVNGIAPFDDNIAINGSGSAIALFRPFVFEANIEQGTSGNTVLGTVLLGGDPNTNDGYKPNQSDLVFVLQGIPSAFNQITVTDDGLNTQRNLVPGRELAYLVQDAATKRVYRIIPTFKDINNTTNLGRIDRLVLTNSGTAITARWTFVVNIAGGDTLPRGAAIAGLFNNRFFILGGLALEFGPGGQPTGSEIASNKLLAINITGGGVTRLAQSTSVKDRVDGVAFLSVTNRQLVVLGGKRSDGTDLDDQDLVEVYDLDSGAEKLLTNLGARQNLRPPHNLPFISMVDQARRQIYFERDSRGNRIGQVWKLGDFSLQD